MGNVVLTQDEMNAYSKTMLDDNLLFELSVVPQMIVNKDRVIVRVNKRFNELFRCTSSNILGKQTIVLTPSEEKFHEYEQYFTQTKEGTFKSEELEYKKLDDTLFWTKLEGIEIHSKDEEILILWSFIDIDKEVKYREKLKFLSSTDSMTQLYNRRFFRKIATDILKIARRDKKNVSVIMLDIDKFKNVNDTYGHNIGDEVIIMLSNVLKKGTRESDIISRWGGEEFVILLPHTDRDGALKIAEKLREDVEKSSIFLKDEKSLKFTVSFGVSEVILESHELIEIAVNRADTALYEAKESGRNRVCFFSDT